MSIKIDNLTKKFSDDKGIFNINLSINNNEVVGFLGPNGAGKTTTIRHLLGLIKQDNGSCFINGLNCFKDQYLIQKFLAYLPGELSLFEKMSGYDYLCFIAQLNKVKNLDRMHYLIDYFELDSKKIIKKMSKGMKQKVGLISVFMQDVSIYILDEPTSGLDPIMQTKFIELVNGLKNKTILLSSHNFYEIEKMCDKVAIINNGKIVAYENIDVLVKKQRKVYRVVFDGDYSIIKDDLNIIKEDKEYVDILVKDDINDFIKFISKVKIKSLSMVSQSLDEIFLDYYGGINE
ncbi:MAG: ABC transporter ATP-binding protein [Mycoplasmatota bacterium]